MMTIHHQGWQAALKRRRKVKKLLQSPERLDSKKHFQIQTTQKKLMNQK
jgi:hypothetical protein